MWQNMSHMFARLLIIDNSDIHPVFICILFAAFTRFPTTHPGDRGRFMSDQVPFGTSGLVRVRVLLRGGGHNETAKLRLFCLLLRSCNQCHVVADQARLSRGRSS
jgi:hypothetical protein